VLALAAASSQCTSTPAAPADPVAAPMTPVLTVKELMEQIVDPQADYAFDFWYPGDREAVLKDRSSKTYVDKPAAAPAK